MYLWTRGAIFLLLLFSCTSKAAAVRASEVMIGNLFTIKSQVELFLIMHDEYNAKDEIDIATLTSNADLPWTEGAKITSLNGKRYVYFTSAVEKDRDVPRNEIAKMSSFFAIEGLCKTLNEKYELFHCAKTTEPFSPDLSKPKKHIQIGEKVYVWMSFN
jgi:hypothetical protein